MPVDQSSLYGGYAKASRPRLPKSVIEGGLSLYGITMANAKGKTDAQLRRMAAKAVLARRKANKTINPATGQPYTFQDMNPSPKIEPSAYGNKPVPPSPQR